jgi:hypothetical protein
LGSELKRKKQFQTSVKLVAFSSKNINSLVLICLEQFNFKIIITLIITIKMEAKLENILENMMQADNTSGALLSDNQGLCYGGEMAFKFYRIK